MEAYWLSILGVLALCLLSVVLAIYSGSSKGFAGALSGPVIPADDANLLYRIDRVHMNSVEALAPFVVPAVLAMTVGVGPATLATVMSGYRTRRLRRLRVRTPLLPWPIRRDKPSRTPSNSMRRRSPAWKHRLNPGS